MKIVLTFGLLLTSTIGVCQTRTEVDLPIDSATGKIVFSEVLPTPNVKKSRLFQALRTWSAIESISKEKRILISDSTNGEIVINYKGDLIALNTSMCFIKFSLTFYAKDQKVKYIFRDFLHEGCYRGETLGKMESLGALENLLVSEKDRLYYDHVLRATKGMVSRMILSFKEAIEKVNERDF